MKCVSVWFCLSLLWIFAGSAAAEAPVSDETQECLDCHATFHPGIVSDWMRSRHAAATPGQAAAETELKRKVSARDIPETLKASAVGCAECHTMRAAEHADTFEHNGYDIHVAVSPADCAVCHAEESEQYTRNIMSFAQKNLADNAVYQDLQRTILGTAKLEHSRLVFEEADHTTQADGCFYCHGTKLEMKGVETRDTEVGPLEFPIIRGWPNQGVGRVNLDGSRGACSSCHTRHQFSIEMARKPNTCKECHVGPDVPGYKVYDASKHGALYAAMGDGWNYKPVPWTIGEDFTAPTCAACHMSLVVDAEGQVISRRTHEIKDRLDWRLFGLIYAHPQPKNPDTTLIRNKIGLPLPTDFEGGFADEYLLDDKEMEKRRTKMQQTCLACHATSWVTSHFNRRDHVVAATNASVRTATMLIGKYWERGLAAGPRKGGSPFDESVERKWMNVWLLYANNIRLSSAMAGGGDYGVFQDGRYPLTSTLIDLEDRLEVPKKRE